MRRKIEYNKEIVVWATHFLYIKAQFEGIIKPEQVEEATWERRIEIEGVNLEISIHECKMKIAIFLIFYIEYKK